MRRPESIFILERLAVKEGGGKLLSKLINRLLVYVEIDLPALKGLNSITGDFFKDPIKED